MNEKRWVQHISGQGEKWEVRDGVTAENTWCVVAKNEHDGYHWLPKSEYHLCDPPEVWKDVSGECEVPGNDRQCTITHKGAGFNTQDGYRFRKVQLWDDYGTKSTKQWAFIVEQKVTE